MGSKIPPIGPPNFRAINGMDDLDIVRVREYHIVKLVSARRARDSDTMEAAIDWIVALTSEMRLRGTRADAGIITT